MKQKNNDENVSQRAVWCQAGCLLADSCVCKSLKIQYLQQ